MTTLKYMKLITKKCLQMWLCRTPKEIFWQLQLSEEEETR